MKNNIYSVLGLALLFIIVQIIAIAITPLYSAAESEAMGGKETIENPGFAFIYLGIILLFTFVILWIAKRKKERFIKVLILAAIFMTMVYLFIPLTMMAIYPPSEDGWEFNEVGSGVMVLNAGDIDNDGIMEIVAGCSDNRIRVYEAENHTLEWESDEFPANISQILVGDIDFDFVQDITVLSEGITVLNGTTKVEKWSYTSDNITTVALMNLTDDFYVLVAGTEDARILVMVNDTFFIELDLTPYLNNITLLDTTDDQRIVVSDGATIVLFKSRVSDIEIDLEITELEEVRALTIYRDPEGEDYIIAADDKRPYLFNLSSAEHIRMGPKFKDNNALYIEHYSIPDYSDSIPEVMVLGKKTVYISPDLLKSDETYYYLEFKYDLYSFLSTDLEGDDEKEMILGTEDGYRFTSIVFTEGPNFLIPIAISILIATSLTLLVHKYPEWYVVDAVGLVMAIGATVILGVTFAILPAIVLLIILGIYDAISVYKTKHMISLADSIMDLNLPVLLVIPKKLSYSYRKKKPRLKEQLESGKEREAMFMGLGDIVIPSLLIVSSLSFLADTQSGIGIDSNILVAIGTMIGILVGFSVLMRFVLKGNPQAGLPLLNSGAILGYLVTYILVYGDFSFGFNLQFM